MTSLALACRVGASSPLRSIPRAVRAILAKYNGTLLLPGAGGALRSGFQPGNYVESTGQTLTPVDGAVGLVLDAARERGPELLLNSNCDATVGWEANGLTLQSSGGIITASFLAGVGYSTMLQYAPTVVGAFYEVVVRAKRTSADSVRFIVGSTITNITTEFATYRFVYQAVGASTLCRVQVASAAATANGTFEVDTFSIKEIPGIQASQTTTQNKPLLRNAGGVQSWQFDGTDDRLTLSAVPFLVTDYFWAVCAHTNTRAAADCKLLSLRNTASGNPLVELVIESRNPILQVRNDAGILSKVSSPAVPVSTPVVVSMVKQASIGNLRVDGVQNPSGINLSSIGALTLNNAVIGASGAGTPSFFFEGRMHGFALGKGAMTPAELLIIEKFLAGLQGRTL